MSLYISFLNRVYDVCSHPVFTSNEINLIDRKLQEKFSSDNKYNIIHHHFMNYVRYCEQSRFSTEERTELNRHRVKLILSQQETGWDIYNTYMSFASTLL